ncbi:MAG: hypothetical protein IPN29_12830 [Saprospiraceae bacterium]|nr:hypothetical protein [Saprospiraceae bacterium]
MNMKIFNIILLASVLISACTDPELDPLQRDKLKSGSTLALRGQSVTNLSSEDFATGVDTFNLLADNSNKTFSFTCDFVSENISDLQSVDVFVVAKGTRTKVLNVPASAFVKAEGTNFNRATITIPHKTLFDAAGGDICAFKPSDVVSGTISYIDIENDINLSDGTIVPASAIVNSSLFESTAFYPAHKLRYVAKGPVSPPVKAFLASGTPLEVDLTAAFVGGSAGVTFEWTAVDNPNVDGEIFSGSGSILMGGTLVNLTTKKQSVVYTVVPTLPNGCKGLPFTVTTAFCDASELAGTFSAKTTGAGLWGGSDACTSTWEGTVIWEELSEGVYNVKTISPNGDTFIDMSQGGYYGCYGANAQNQLPEGTLRITHQCDKLAFIGTSKWDEVYKFDDVKVDDKNGKKLTIKWSNTYGEAAVVELTRTDKDWPSSTSF